MAERTGLTREAFDALVERVNGAGDEVPASIARLAAAAMPAACRCCRTTTPRRSSALVSRARLPRRRVPGTEETARDAAAAGDFIVFGAPNVVRGGSHTGWTSATDMVRKGLCTILASDYYYPALLLAAFRLAAEGMLPLPKAWALISTRRRRQPACTDRGALAPGQRADLVLVDAQEPLRPRIVAVIAAGKLVHVTESVSRSRRMRRRAQLAAELSTMSDQPRYAIYHVPGGCPALPVRRQRCSAMMPLRRRISRIRGGDCRLRRLA